MNPNPRGVRTNQTFQKWSNEQWLDRKGPRSIGVGNTLACLGLPHVDPTGYQTIVDKIQAQTAEYLPEIYTDVTKKGWLAQRDILAKNFAGNKSGVIEIPFSGQGSAAMSLEKPLSRGSVTLQPGNKYAEPALEYQLLANPADLDIMVSVFKFTRTWYAAQTELTPQELSPGASVTSDEDLAQAIKQAMGPSTAHGCCTAAMMPRDIGGVVASDLTVYGVTGLSVGDISMMPLIPATHTCSTVYALAEKVSTSFPRSE